MWFLISGWLLVILTVLGNGFVIYLIITKPRLQTKANWFILSLAVSDLCSRLACFPAVLSANIFHTIDFHPGVFFKVSFTFLYCSNANLCAVTVDRYLAITRPLRYLSLMTKKTVCCMLFVAWTSPLLFFSLPAIFSYRGNPAFTMAFEICRVSIFQVFPFVMFTFVTCRLLYLAWNASRQIRKTLAQVRFNHAASKASIAPTKPPRPEKRSASIMVILILMVFNITYLGGNYRCFCLLFGTCPYTDILKKAIFLVVIANAAVNPMIYGFLKKDIRQELRKVFNRPH